MKIKKILYPLLCAAGGAMIGIFAGKLDTVPGAVLFCIGVTLCTFSVARASK